MAKLLDTNVGDNFLVVLTPEGPKRIYLDQLFRSGNSYASNQKIDDYLFLTHYNSIDYEKGFAYCKDRFASEETKKKMILGTGKCLCECDCCTSHNKRKAGACTAVRVDDYVGRNFDFFYNECATFVVRMPRSNGRYASIGVAGQINALTNELATAGEYNDGYDILPFFTFDGVNEYGVFCENNLTNSEDIKKRTIGTLPKQSREVEISMPMIPRFVLDHFKTAAEAVAYLRDHCFIYAPMTDKLNYECHFMIADKDQTSIIEFVDNKFVEHTVLREDNEHMTGIMTNFYNTEAEYYSDGTINSACFDKPTLKHAAGVERYNLCANRINENIDSWNYYKTRDLMQDLRYTHFYSTSKIGVGDPFWYSEYAADYGDKFGDLTTKDAVGPDAEDKFADVVEYAGQLYLEKDKCGKRDDRVWHTVHSSIYDLETGSLYITSQEDNVEYRFDVCVGTEAYKVNELEKEEEV